MLTAVAPALRQFDFASDTLAFPNQLHWQYLIDENTGRVTTRKNDPPPTYAHRCFVVVRRARQFFFHAKFDPTSPPLPNSELERRAREVIRRSCTQPSPENNRITFPGYENLRDFSAAHESLLKQVCGGAWQSYVNEGHWRMLFPFSRTHQAREAARLASITHTLPIIHIVRFPQLTINHALLIYGAERHATGIDFQIYDPNLPEKPSILQFTNRDNTFHLPRNIYWAGGRVDVYETYRP